MDPINRAYYRNGTQRSWSRSGQDTTILMGFLQQLLALLSTSPRPSYCCVAFDAAGADFRESKYPSYKGQREEKAIEIVESIPMIQRALDYLDIKWVCVHGVEADDAIGTLAHRFASNDVHAYLFSRDKARSAFLSQAASDSTCRISFSS